MQEHIAYFDNAATSFPKPETVYQAMDDCARNYGVSMGAADNICCPQELHS